MIILWFNFGLAGLVRVTCYLFFLIFIFILVNYFALKSWSSRAQYSTFILRNDFSFRLVACSRSVTFWRFVNQIVALSSFFFLGRNQGVFVARCLTVWVWVCVHFNSHLINIFLCVFNHLKSFVPFLLERCFSEFNFAFLNWYPLFYLSFFVLISLGIYLVLLKLFF